jgi:hypothetical protein
VVTPLEPSDGGGISVLIFSPSADKLRAKAGRTMVDCADVGHSEPYLKRGIMSERSGGKV